MKLFKLFTLSGALLTLVSCGGNNNTIPEEYDQIEAAYKRVVAKYADNKLITVCANPRIRYLAYDGSMYKTPEFCKIMIGFIDYYHVGSSSTDTFDTATVYLQYQSNMIDITVGSASFDTPVGMPSIHLNQSVTFYYPISEHQVQPLDHYETTATDLTEDQLNWFGDTPVRFAVTNVVNFINVTLFEEMGSYFL